MFLASLGSPSHSRVWSGGRQGSPLAFLRQMGRSEEFLLRGAGWDAAVPKGMSWNHQTLSARCHFLAPPATKIHPGGLHPVGTTPLQRQHSEGRLPGGLPRYFFLTLLISKMRLQFGGGTKPLRTRRRELVRSPGAPAMTGGLHNTPGPADTLGN